MISCIRYQEPFFQFEFILSLLCLEIFFTIVNKRNKNLLLTYYYGNIIINNCLIICDSKGMYNNYGDDLVVFVRSRLSYNVGDATFTFLFMQFLYIAQLIKMWKILKL